jgi:hypothetical protein
MKITNAEVRSKNAEVRNRAAGNLLPSAFCLRTSQRGIALVMTLILLSVALVMALAFLAISGRERGSVTTQTDATAARLATDAGLAAAEAQIAANVLATTNPYNFGLLVSTNYVVPPVVPANPLADLTNLFVAPRAPVWLSNLVTHTMENQFYLDLNRNGVDDPNGWVTNVDANGNSLGTVSFQVGDPEWIGILAHPDQPYGPNNLFIARYAFIALPVGNSLDLNAIYNQTLNRSLSLTQDGYFRNQGVGTWEINLAAFLADLNTNEWDSNIGGVYQYNQPLGFANLGMAFNDAFALLTNRYAGNYNTLAPVGGTTPPGLFTTANFFPPFQDNIDAYSDGPLQTTTAGINDGGQIVTLPWAGADNTNHYFDVTADLFDPNKIPPTGFTSRLQQAGANNSTYDRYTFYRLLAQLGTDTAPESGKMNLNYDNLDPGFPGVLNTNGVPSETNFIPWQPLGFFTNAADRLLKAYTAQWATGYYTNLDGSYQPTNSNPAFVATFNVTAPFGVTDIPVWVSNRFVYTPAVNRLLQLAANMYDATTSNLGMNGNRDYPSVFRPLFSRDANSLGIAGLGTNLFITGYTNVTSFAGQNFTLPIDVSDLAATNIPVVNLPVNVYGVPWIVGAKKGFPNFNELAMDTAFQITRKVEVTRSSTNALPNTYSYYQMFILSLTNQVGVECWNSYTNSYTNGVMIYVYDDLKNIVLTNDEGFRANLSNVLSTAYPVTAWPGFTPGVQTGPSFQIPLDTAVMTISNSIYRFNRNGIPYLAPDLNETYETNVTGYPQPHWGLTVANDLWVVMVDGSKIIDYVEFSGPNSLRDLTGEIIANYDKNPDGSAGVGGNDLWDTHLNNQGIPTGLYNQIQVSLGVALTPPDADNGGPWPNVNSPEAQSQENSVDGFRAFFHLTPIYNALGSQQAIAAAEMTNNMQAPFTPTATVVQHVSWQANDPLVHYLASDLNWASAVRSDHTVTSLTDSSDGDNLGMVNTRYAPWGILMSAGTDQVDQNKQNLAYKDPLVSSSDNWDFPSYKLPNVGWLGRVHRGTPWQTVYLKSTNILDLVQTSQSPADGPTTWRDWTGNYNPFDAAAAGPVQDWLLFDLFTAAVSDNATRGTLSVNQSAGDYDPIANPAAGLAAWSAVFSGIVVPNPTNANDYALINPAGPAGLNSPLGILVTNINYTRANFTNADGLVGAFEHKGDILAVPQLTEQSPFLDPAQTGYNNDAMYEWLPQQVMGLLRLSAAPRYVIYSYGQTLKPAPNGTYLGAGTFFQMVTNYQVVAETATRTVVRFDTARTNAVTEADGVTNSVITVTPPRAVIESSNLLPPD